MNSKHKLSRKGDLVDIKIARGVTVDLISDQLFGDTNLYNLIEIAEELGLDTDPDRVSEEIVEFAHKNS